MRRSILGTLVLATVIGSVAALGLLAGLLTPDAQRAHAQGIPATVSGVVRDALLQPLPNQRVVLSSAGGSGTSAITGVNGAYSMQVSRDVVYGVSLDINPGSPIPASAAIPLNYAFAVSNALSVTGDTILNVDIPAKAVTVKVKNGSGDLLPDVGVSTLGVPVSGLPLGPFTGASGTSSTGFTAVPTNASGEVKVWLFPTSGQGYTFSATPPSGSPYAPGQVTNVTFTSDITVEITLVAPVTLSGTVRDALGQPLPNQRVVISTGSVGASAVTNASGVYSMTAAPGTYGVSLDINPGGTIPADAAIPLNYAFSVSNALNLTANTTLNVDIPAKAVTVKVKNSAGDPLPNVGVSTPGVPVSGLPLGPFSGASGTSSTAFTSVPTNAQGEARIWLFPTSSQGYTFALTPPSGSPYGAGQIANVTFSSDTTVSATLVATVTLSGVVRDALGQPLPNQRVVISAGLGVSSSAVTNGAGEYSMTATPGTYGVSLDINPGGSVPAGAAIPVNYAFSVSNALNLTTNATLNVDIPAKAVTVRILAPDGSPLPNVGVSTLGVPVSGLPLGPFSGASGASSTGFTAVPTNASGEVKLWLFPTTPGAGVNLVYSLAVAPAAGSGFVNFAVQGLAVAADMTETIQLGQTTPLGLAAAGTQTVQVRSTGGFTPGSTLIFNPGGATQEKRTLVAIGSLVLNQPLQFAHAPGEQIVAPAAVCSSGRPKVPKQVSQFTFGQIRAILTAPTTRSLTGNVFTSVRIDKLDNAQVDLVGIANNLAVNVSVPVSAPTLTLMARRQAPGPFTVRVTVIDACGAYPTFFGGGNKVT